MDNEIPPGKVALIFELPAIRPKVDEGGWILDKAALLTISHQLAKAAKAPAVKAVKVTVEPGGVRIQVATR
jgi:hypothetical protein